MAGRHVLLASEGLGVGRNLFGIVRWTGSLGASVWSLMADRLARAPAEVCPALRGRMTLAFAI